MPKKPVPSENAASARGARQLVRSAARRHWRSLGAGGFGAVLITIADLASVFPLAWVIDRVLRNRTGSFDLSSDDIWLLGLLVQAVIAVAVLSALGSYIADLSLQRAGEQITHDLRVRVYNHLQRLSLAFHDQRRKGDLVTRLTGDVNAVGSLFSSVIGNIVQAGLVLVGMAVVAIWLDPLLALVLFAGTPILFFVTRWFRRRLRAAAREQRLAEAEIASLANESLSAMRVVKAFGTEEYEQERVVDHSENRRRVGVVAAALDARFGGIVDVLGAITIAVVLAFGAVRVSNGALTVGGLVIFLHYARRVYRPLRDIAKYMTAAARSMARAERIAEVLSADQTLDEKPGAYSGPRADGAIVLEGVTFGYTAERPVIRGVNLTVRPGETVAIVGPSGAGKSTIGALVARFYDPSQGRVLIDGRDARDCSLQWLRTQVGFLLQDTVLFSGTIGDNIAYGVRSSPAAIRDAARAADAHGFIAGLPDGYDTELGAQGVGLSGGQRQRIGVARVLLRDPPILILDEPTTGLDATSEAQLVDGLGGLMTGRTCLLITHSLALAQRADRVVVIGDGGIVQEGAPADLLDRPGPFRRLASLQGLVGGIPRPGRDAALPAMRHLLDPDVIAPTLQESLGAGRVLDDVTVHRVRYRPSRRLVVHYRATIDGVAHDAVASIDSDDSAAAAASDPRNVAAAHAVNGRSPARTPLLYDERLGALIQWLPLDIDIPATAVPPGDLAERLRSAGVPLGVTDERPTLSAYRPGRRATFDFGDTLVTCWAREGDAYRVARSAAHAAAIGLIDRGAALGHVPALRVTVRPDVTGSRMADAAAAAADAGPLLAYIHGLPGGALEVIRPAHELVAVTRAVATLHALVPELHAELDAFVGRMINAGPRANTLDEVTSHGAFRHDRLLRVDGGLRPISLDALRRAPAAADIATYAMGVVEGPDDVAAAHRTLEALLTAYGSVPAGLGWYLAAALIRRADRPFRLQHREWPARVAGLVELSAALVK